MGSDASPGPSGAPAVLALDTTADQCAVALVRGDRAVLRVEHLRRGHAERLFPLIEAVLAEAGAGFDSLDRLVCCTGPGSFAGTRIGVAAARGLALSTGVPATGVSRFEALAAAAGDPGQSVAVVLAGRGDSAWFQAFGRDGAALAPPEVVDATAPGAGWLDGIDLIAGDGAPGWQGLPRRLPSGLVDPVVLARLGGAGDPGAPPAPLYLRPPAADLPREAPPRILG